MYRKFTADLIFSGHEMLQGNAVLITDKDGQVIEITDKKDAGEGVEYFNGLLTPGFINSHCHLELSHLKGRIPQMTGLQGFVQQVMNLRTASDEEKYNAMCDAEQELYNGGTVAVGDICNTTDSIPVKQKSELLWHNFIEVSGFVDAVAEKRLQESKKVFELFQTTNNKPGYRTGRQQTTLSPHAPYSVSKKLFRLLNDETADQVITIHNQESEAENELYKNKAGVFLKLYKDLGIDISFFQPTGKSSLQNWLPYFTKGQSIILVHNTFTEQEDISFCQLLTSNIQLPTFFCLCPNANKYIEGKLPPMDLLRKNNCNIIIGTDSYAGNGQLDLFEEIKTIQRGSDFNIPLEEILKWATINGARALRFDDRLGSFDKGKRPGVVLIDKLNGLDTTINSKARRIL